jgi:hypothetical protein
LLLSSIDSKEGANPSICFAATEALAKSLVLPPREDALGAFVELHPSFSAALSQASLVLDFIVL